MLTILRRLIGDKTLCLVNGLGNIEENKLTKERQGSRITDMNEADDYITFEIIKTEERNKTERTTKEIVYIPISKIESISEGEK
jgi:hypothetical protein